MRAQEEEKEEGHEHHHAKDSGVVAHRLRAHHVDGGHSSEDGGAKQPARDGVELKVGKCFEVADEEDGVEGEIEQALEDLPETHLKARRLAKGAVHPHHVAAHLGDGRGELRCHERLRQGPHPRHDEETREGEARARGAHHAFDAKRPATHGEEGDHDELDAVQPPWRPLGFCAITHRGSCGRRCAERLAALLMRGAEAGDLGSLLGLAVASQERVTAAPP
mmetsp:Transcript_1813/g.5086  ORF Transcript_1813/g.5086 Transcript_1813/m.5086 type:complete len:221 (-) Transcript_1813:1851-2513(-)